MKQPFTSTPSFQQKIFYLFLLLLLVGGVALPALANPTSNPYKIYVDQAITALDNADTRAAYAAFAKARKLARKNNDREKQDAFRDCLQKIPYYQAYFPLIQQAERQLQEENYNTAEASLLAAREQLDLSIAIGVDEPDFTQYETTKRLDLENRIQAIEAVRLPLIQQAIASGEDKLLQGRPGEALEDFRYAGGLALDQADENRKYRIGERILKAEIHYDVYTQVNLGRREAGYRNYREAQTILQDALVKLESSREHYFPRLEAYDLSKYREVEQLLGEVDAKRVKSYQLALQRGQDLLEKDQPAEALQAFNYARQQMFEDRNEPQTTGVDALAGRANYNLLVHAGDNHLRQGHFPDAIAAYEEAKQHLQTDDIARKIDQTRNAGYQQALAQGRQAFAQGQYAEAKAYYDAAAGFRNDPALQTLLEQHYQELFQQGQRETDKAAFAQAKIHYENARLFADTPEIQELIGETQGGADYASAFAEGEQYLRAGQVAAARESFERARAFRHSVEVQQQLFTIEDYQMALNDGRRAFENGEADLARAYFQNAQDIYNTPEINDWLRQTDRQTDRDRLAVQPYDAQPVFAARTGLTPKGIGAGRIDFDFNTVLWMRPDCSLTWSVELYNSYGALTGTASVDGNCRFSFTNLPDGTYTFKLKLQDGGKTAFYRTETNEVILQNGETATVTIDAVGRE